LVRGQVDLLVYGSVVRLERLLLTQLIADPIPGLGTIAPGFIDL
jgi:hypothetical protein